MKRNTVHLYYLIYLNITFSFSLPSISLPSFLCHSSSFLSSFSLLHNRLRETKIKKPETTKIFNFETVRSVMSCVLAFRCKYKVLCSLKQYSSLPLLNYLAACMFKLYPPVLRFDVSLDFLLTYPFPGGCFGYNCCTEIGHQHSTSDI